MVDAVKTKFGAVDGVHVVWPSDEGAVDPQPTLISWFGVDSV